MVKAGYRGANVQTSGNEIIMILAFAVGLIIVLYMLAKREVASIGSDAAKAASDAINGIVKTVSDTASGAVKGVLDAGEKIAETSNEVREVENTYYNPTVRTVSPFLGATNPMFGSTLAGINIGGMIGFNIAKDISGMVYGDTPEPINSRPLTAQDYIDYPGVLLPDTSAPNPLIKPGYFTGGWPP